MQKVFLILTGVALLFISCRMPGKSRFSEYPIGKTFTVNFSYPDLAREEFSDREKADQGKGLAFVFINVELGAEPQRSGRSQL